MLRSVLTLVSILLLAFAATRAEGEQGGEGALAAARTALEAGEDGRAVKILRQHLAAQGGLAATGEARLVLAEAYLRLGKSGRAHAELERTRHLYPEWFAASGGEALLLRAQRSFVSLGDLQLEVGPPLAAQVFVVLRLRGGPRQLWRPLAEAGVEMGIVRAFHVRGDRTHEGIVSGEPAGAYFATRHVPLIEDRLATDCAAMRAAGLRCWAWMTTRLTPSPRLQKAKHRDVLWNFRTGKFERGTRLDLFDPVVVSTLEEVYRDLARSGADGVLFQDDLAMRQLAGFSRPAQAAWRRATGRALDPSELVEVVSEGGDRRVRYLEGFWEFARFKRDRLLEVAERLRAAARKENPRFEVALNLYYEAALSQEDTLAWFAQDLEAAAATDFRWLAVMVYHRQIAKELELDETALSETLKAMAGRLARVPDARHRVLVKFQTIDWDTREPIPAAELARVAAHFSEFALCLAPIGDPARVAPLFAAIRPELGS